MIDASINIQCSHSRVPDDDMSDAGTKDISYGTISANNHTLLVGKMIKTPR